MDINYTLPVDRKEWTPAEDALNDACRAYSGLAAQLRKAARILRADADTIAMEAGRAEDLQSHTLRTPEQASLVIVTLMARMDQASQGIEALVWVCQQTEPPSGREPTNAEG